MFYNQEGCRTKATFLFLNSLFQFQTVFESVSDSFGNPIISLRIRIVRYCVDERNIDFVSLHNFFIRAYIQNFSDYADTVLVRLVFDKLAFEAQRKLVDNRCVD